MSVKFLIKVELHTNDLQIDKMQVFCDVIGDRM